MTAFQSLPIHLMKIIILIACVLLSFHLYTIQNVIKDINSYKQVKTIPYVKKTKWVKSEVISMLAQKAVENDLSPHYLIKLAECESGASSTIQSFARQPYGREQSFGIFQIHVKAHTDVTVEQAKDPEFNTNWAINRIKKGYAPKDWVHCNRVASSV